MYVCDVMETLFKPYKACTGLKYPTPRHSPNDVQGVKNYSFPDPGQTRVCGMFVT